jgi:hypothetical protein
MPLKKSARSKTTVAKKSSTTGARSKKSKTPSWSVGAGTMLLAAICVTGAVIVIAAHELTPVPRVTAADTENERAAAPESAKAAPSPSPSVSESAMANAPETDTPEAKGTVGRTAPVTIFGCLERSESTFRLTDTDGVDAPKARSWKTAFLKKGAASIEVVDQGNRLRLASHVGQRLSVTGMLSDRQMQVRSIRRISSTCN